MEVPNENLKSTIEDIVQELYNYRDYYFDDHPIEHANYFHSDVKECLNKTLLKLKSLEEKAVNEDRSYYFYVLGKAYNVERDYNIKAEELLSKAVKLNPSLIDAWNQLGDTYFKKGQYSDAKNCFTNALNKKKNKESLRNISVVLRKENGKTEEDIVTNINLGLKYAQEALELDPNDGTSWFYMGNAFMSSFFTVKQSAKTLKQAMDAYSRAETDKAAKNNPDLYYNKAVALKFQEEYETALQYFDKAHAFDPLWKTPKVLQDRLLKYLNSTQSFVTQKGRIKNKKLQALIKSIKPEKHLISLNKLFENSSSNLHIENVPFSQLKLGLNVDKVVLGVVVCSIQNEDLVPFTFCIIDSEGTCMSVTVYNLANGQGVIIGDVITIAMPALKEINFHFANEQFNYKNIRVSNPLLMAVNGKLLSSSKLSSMKMSTFSEADNEV